MRSATAPDTIDMAAIAKPNCMNQNSLLETVKPKPKSFVLYLYQTQTNR